MEAMKVSHDPYALYENGIHTKDGFIPDGMGKRFVSYKAFNMQYQILYNESEVLCGLPKSWELTSKIFEKWLIDEFYRINGYRPNGWISTIKELGRSWFDKNVVITLEVSDCQPDC